MPSILINKLSAIWAFLMAATIASTWWISKDSFTISTATVLIMLIAAYKIRLVMIHFMELDHAPLHWRLWFECWIGVSTAAILLSYFNLTPW
ncbi:cytochrome C oxidase subunit IV family protein [Pseudomonas fluorescens]|uniref:Prokaryotic cytochrome C oxidase subunit IV family protein n=1 Tax=Pseudomonas fluorescens TaxID=294 RepID=A0A5E7UY56_PSEFL|nr:cytochrome C oxidase subunit IV family protein [Pseudomonas fluorescens]VVQ15495.1 hypothetical protein PS928_04269 [Pseudomonas fluorescens]